MINCLNIPVSIPKDGSLSKTLIRDIISSVFWDEWRHADPETLTVTKNTGYANQNIVVERPQQSKNSEPSKVFLKIHGLLDGEIEIFKHLVPSKQEEAQLCKDYGLAGLGAKVYGFFQTQDGALGRVDEFLDARNLEPGDVENEEIRADIARGHAVFHSMSAPLRKQSVQLYYDAITAELARYHRMDKLKDLAQQCGVTMDDLVDYDFVPRIRRVIQELELIGGKKGWCIHDVQFMNVMNYRAFDIGGHFMQKMFKWFDEENKLANCRPYTEEEKRHFCDEYAKQWNQTTGDSDTGEQVFIEAELGYMLALTFDIHNMLNFMDQEEDKDPLNIIGLNKLYEEFESQYKRLGFEGKNT